jgi:tRNA-dihydrouridine synthase A
MKPLEITADQPVQKHRFCIAPMMDWTDRHCRFLHRILSRKILLYTEMVTTGALLYGDVSKHLDFDSTEHPVALQLGGNEPYDLAQAAKLGERWGYREINLNCGCPSSRVQQGAFGATLMSHPQRVRECIEAIQNVCSLPVTVKHRIGLNNIDSYDFVRDFVGTVAQSGCETFIVHARSAILSGLSPKENRDIPPLKYEYAYQLKQDFPMLQIVLNGGITTTEAIKHHWQYVDGIMIGRHAYHQPYFLADADNLISHQDMPIISREEVEEKFCAYACTQLALGTPVAHLIRHVLGLYHGQAGARNWRRILSDHHALAAIRHARDLISLFKKARQELNNGWSSQ